MADTSKKTILLIATLDTKAAEARFLKESVESQGCAVMVMNPGILAAPPYKPDVDNVELAAAAGEDLKVLLASKDKGRCIAAMMAGCAVLTRKLYDEGKIQGVVSIGGDQGTNIGTTAMRALPFGVPKFMVSTVATGRAKFGEYTKTKDIIIMHSVADIAGLNRVTRSVLWKAPSPYAMVKSDEARWSNSGAESRCSCPCSAPLPRAPCAPSLPWNPKATKSSPSIRTVPAA